MTPGAPAVVECGATARRPVTRPDPRLGGLSGRKTAPGGRAIQAQRPARLSRIAAAAIPADEVRNTVGPNPREWPRPG